MFIIIALLGWVAGALVNYLADVLPFHRKLTRPPCLHCGEALAWSNYLFWPRQCPACQRRRSLRTWIVEAAAIGFALWMWQSPPEGLGFVGGLILMVYFGLVFVIDLEHRLILHPVSIAGAVLGLFLGIYLRSQEKTLLEAVISTLIGGMVGFGSMWGLFYLGGLFSKAMARRRGETMVEDALGFGDVNLSGVLGLILGWPAIVPGLFLAMFLGGMFSLAYMLVLMVARRYKALTAIPYGPFLISAAVILIYFNDWFRSLLQ